MKKWPEMTVEFRGKRYSCIGDIASALYDAGEPADFVEIDCWGWKVVRTDSKIQLWRYRGLVPQPEHAVEKIMKQLVAEREVT